jgi:hypothetical protein
MIPYSRAACQYPVELCQQQFKSEPFAVEK